jgi:hypothetical protein
MNTGAKGFRFYGTLGRARASVGNFFEENGLAKYAVVIGEPPK